VFAEIKAVTCDESTSKKSNFVRLGGICPKMASKPWVTGKTDRGFTVNWQPINGLPGVKYELYSNEGNGAFYPRTPLMPASNKTSFFVSKSRGSNMYRFYVKAVTDCCQIRSPEITVDTCIKPAKMSAPRVRCHDGELQI